MARLFRKKSCTVKRCCDVDRDQCERTRDVRADTVDWEHRRILLERALLHDDLRNLSELDRDADVVAARNRRDREVLGWVRSEEEPEWDAQVLPVLRADVQVSVQRVVGSIVWVGLMNVGD